MLFSNKVKIINNHFLLIIHFSSAKIFYYLPIGLLDALLNHKFTTKVVILWLRSGFSSFRP